MTQTADGGPRIVLIEDNPGDVYLIELALKFHHIDCQLTHFEDGEEALRGLLDGEATPLPDLILVDLNLPRVDGKQVLSRMREHPTLGAVPIAVLTSSFSPRDYDDVVKLGARKYIHKPTRLQDYLSAIGGAVKELLA
jgi:CheY-like chemotaxis protein